MKAFDHDMISRYLDGEMNGEELTTFEEQLQQDADLQKEVELVKELNEILQMKLHPDENELALTGTMKEMRGEYFSSDTAAERSTAKIIPMQKRRWMMAAAAVFIAVVMLTIWSPWKKEDLYQQYASLEMPGVAERGTPSDSLLKQATNKFNDKKFGEALIPFENILKEDPQNSYVHYYYAIALLQSGETERSRNELTQLFNGTSVFRYDAGFYLALSYLKEKDKTNCASWLNKIPADAPVFNKAQELLKKLQ